MLTATKSLICRWLLKSRIRDPDYSSKKQNNISEIHIFLYYNTNFSSLGFANGTNTCLSSTEIVIEFYIYLHGLL